MVSQKDINDWIFNFVYLEAMEDATKRTRVASKKVDYLKDKKAKKIVKDYIQEVILGKNPQVIPTANKVVSALNSEETNNKIFTFGNAQKLINIAAKHYYLLVCRDVELRNNFKCCDCPMDRTMIEKAISRYKVFLSINKINKKDDAYINITWPDKETGERKRTIDWSVVSWSLLNCEEDIDIYRKFQAIVTFLSAKIDMYPIEYDYKYFGIEKPE